MATSEVNYGKHLQNIKAQAAVLLVGIMLSVDTLNPITLICGTLGVPTYLAAYPFAILLIYLLIGQASDIMYHGVRVFFTSILSIFFAKIDVIGHSNVPLNGPIIFTGNHANQFVDALQVLTNCGHKVGFLIAMKSYHRPIIGLFSRAMGCIPVTRPQDAAVKCPPTEKIKLEGTRVLGQNTTFTKLINPNDRVRLRGQDPQLKVVEVISNTEAVLADPAPTDMEALGWHNFDVLRHVDQAAVFDLVHYALSKGRCIGIFPEGGSHDRTDLLPLKAGVAIIAFGAMEKYNVSVPVVPIGLNYFRGHRFRGRATVEFGPPLRISEELFELYKRDRRAAYTEFLMQVEDSMRACLVTAPDYDSLRLVYVARRLFQSNHKIPTPGEKQDMNRRFAEGYKKLLQQYKVSSHRAEDAAVGAGADEGLAQLANAEQDLPADARALKDRLDDYRRKLNRLGLRDYQVPTLTTPDPLKATYTVLHLFLVAMLAAVPTLILNAPVGIVARIMAAKERKKALAGSVVKVAARDVMMSKKIIISIVMVPTLWITYAVLLYLYSGWKTSTVVLVVLCLPVFSYTGIMATEAGMVDLKDLKPLLMRLRPKMLEEMRQLPEFRRQLQKELREFVSKVGPSLGPIYTDPDLKWGDVIRNNPESRNLKAMADTAAHVMDPAHYEKPSSVSPSSRSKKDT